MAKKLKEWFDGDCAALLGRAIAAHHTSFDIDGYISEVENGVSNLELKDRVRFMSDALRKRLPDKFENAAVIIQASLGPPLSSETGMFTTGYWLMPVARLVEDHGLAYPDISLNLCEAITQRHTAEYAVRPYIKNHKTKALKRIREWTHHPNSHVRRLASEGIRPRLPWASRLEEFTSDPSQALEIVEPLCTDPSPYVRKSVANLINDISKDHPEKIIKLIAQWQNEATKETEWIIRHGSRTLRKHGLCE